jgi:hypothetical protein
MVDIKKEELKRNVFVIAHNAGEMTDEVQACIDAFDIDTYLKFLNIALEKRVSTDVDGDTGGGSRSAAYLEEGIKSLEDILSR